MKKIILLSSLFLLCLSAKAQISANEHTIKVIGTAELEIVPDEIYVSITLREYTKDKKKFTIEELEKNLVNYIEKVTMTDKKDIKMDNMSAYIIGMKRKNKDEVITKSYDVKFKNAQQVYQIYAVMDSLGMSRAAVSKYSHSKMDEYKKQIKINAIKAARDKADYLMSAIGQMAGKAVEVEEKSGLVSIDDGINNTYRTRNEYAQSNVSYRLMDGGFEPSSSDDKIGDKTIKLSYNIEVEFEIK